MAKSLDRETKESYDLRIVSTDGGEPKLESVKQLPIKIVDVNDNPPTFVRKDYEATIQENAKKGQEIIPITAIDHDEGENGCFAYALADSYGGIFRIEQKEFESGKSCAEENSARIILAQELDADSENARAEYELNITATDQGTVLEIYSPIWLYVFLRINLN